MPMRRFTALRVHPHCTVVPDGLWVEVDGKGDCIRAYTHGLSGTDHSTILVYFSGDALLKTTSGLRFVAPGYEKRSPDGLRRDMARWSQQAGHPTIFLAGQDCMARRAITMPAASSAR